jgi:hypothetical protein
MAELVQDSIMDGTVNNHGISDQIISIIQMHQAWVLVIMVPITLGSLPMLHDIIKVIMDAETNTMTTRTRTMATNSVAEVGVEEVLAVEATGMVQMKHSHNSFPSSLVQEKEPMAP